MSSVLDYNHYFLLHYIIIIYLPDFVFFSTWYVITRFFFGLFVKFHLKV